MMVSVALAADTPVSDFHVVALPDRFIEHGKVSDLYRLYGLDDESMLHRIQTLLGSK
jgi:deoxyxylulose-5-phosphate synthase